MNFKEFSIFGKGLKDSFKNRHYLEMVLFFLLIAQFMVCVIFNLTSLKSHVGFDSSWSFLKTVLIWNDKTLASPVWSEQNNLFFDSATLFAVPFYAITHNLFLSFGIVNIIVLLLLLLSMSSILSEIDLGIRAKLIVLNLIICPFLTNGFKPTNDIMYFSNICVGAAHSAVRSLIALMIIYEFIRIRKTDKFTVQTYVTFALCVLTGMAAGVFMAIMILIPFILYEIEMVFIKNDHKLLIKKESCYAFISLIFVGIGKVIASSVLHTDAIDTDRTWTSIEKVWTNIVAVFQGMLGLLGVLPEDDAYRVSIMSMDGIKYIWPIIVFAVLLISFFFCAVKVKNNYQEKDGVLLFILNIVVVNCLIFSMFNVQYGAKFFEDRYLITTFYAALILMAYFLDKLDPKLIFTSVLTLALTLAIIDIDFESDINYMVSSAPNMEIAEQMDEYFDLMNDSELVYVWGQGEISFETTLRVYDLDRYYKLLPEDDHIFHFGDYKYYDNNADYSGPTYLVARTDAEDIPENILNKYELVNTIDNYNIYRCDSNPVNFSKQSSITFN